MYSDKIPQRQLSAWLCAALIPTVIQLTAGSPWVSVLLVSAISLLCIFLRWHYGITPEGKLWLMLQWLLAVAVLGEICRSSVKSWPRGGHDAVALILLALALWSALKGTYAAARVGCVLFWFILLLYLVLLGAGIKEVKMSGLIPSKGDADAMGCVLLLTPAAAGIHLAKEEVWKPQLAIIGGFCTVAAAVTAGVLSPYVAGVRENAFYEMTRSLNLLGQARRFEAVLSAGMTVGWFSLMSLYLSVSAKLAEIIRTGSGKVGAIGAAILASGYLLCGLTIPGWLLLILTAIFWVLLPLLTQGLGMIKKS